MVRQAPKDRKESLERRVERRAFKERPDPQELRVRPLRGRKDRQVRREPLASRVLKDRLALRESPARA